MKYLLLSLIRVYWLIPRNKRHKCLFTQTCSNYVFTITKRDGWIAGVKSFVQRFRQCRPGYCTFSTKDGKEWVMLKDKSVIERKLTAI